GAGVDDVLIVIAGVMPAADAGAPLVTAADIVEPGVVLVAGGVVEVVAAVVGGDRRAAAPEVHRPGDEPEGLAVQVSGDAKRSGLGAFDDEAVVAGGSELGEVSDGDLLVG